MMARTLQLPPPPPNLLDGASLFLDFDGTLVDIAARPDGVTVARRVHVLMELLRRKLEGRIAIVSGRPADTVRSMFGTPEFAIGGSHGLELYWADGRSASPPRANLNNVLAALRAFEVRTPGVLVEEKPYGAALHYRLAPDSEVQCRELIERLAAEHGLAVQAGKMVTELKVTDANKGGALEAFMRQPPMRGTRPVFVGDDETDEAGFAAAARFGGAGVLVGEPRATTATYGLAGVNDTLCWLEAYGKGS